MRSSDLCISTSNVELVEKPMFFNANTTAATIPVWIEFPRYFLVRILEKVELLLLFFAIWRFAKLLLCLTMSFGLNTVYVFAYVCVCLCVIFVFRTWLLNSNDRGAITISSKKKKKRCKIKSGQRQNKSTRFIQMKLNRLHSASKWIMEGVCWTHLKIKV